MKTKLILSVVGLAFCSLSTAEMLTNPTELKPLNDVRISMQRMLRSSEGRYFLSLYAGVWNPHGTLYDLVDNRIIKLKGLQKADQLNLNSIEIKPEVTGNTSYQLAGVLNANSGDLSAKLTQNTDITEQTLVFEPAIKISNRPNFMFKFYGTYEPKEPYVMPLKRVDIINKNNNNVVQSLLGFTAFPKSIGYMDINFDGYYDIVLSDISQDRTIKDKRYIYWMYNPKTQQFQRSLALENIIGFPDLDGEKQQINFGNGQLYQVENGLLNRIEAP